MDWPSLLVGIVGIAGTVAGYLAKDLIDILKQERAHTLDLQKRYFDQKFSVTLQTVKQLKWFAARLLAEYRLIKMALQNEDAVHHTIMIRFGEQQRQAAAQLASEAVGADALIPFFFDEHTLAKGEALRECSDRILPPLSRALTHADYLKMWGDCHGDPSFTEDKLSVLEAKEEKMLLDAINELLPLLEQYNNLIDDVARTLARDFRHYKS